MKTINIDQDGVLTFVHDEQFADGIDGEVRTERATHVEPVQPLLRWCFRAFRRHVADDSWVAAWTRRWQCRWRARIFATNEILGPFEDRKQAILAEIVVLEGRLDSHHFSLTHNYTSNFKRKYHKPWI